MEADPIYYVISKLEEMGIARTIYEHNVVSSYLFHINLYQIIHDMSHICFPLQQYNILDAYPHVDLEDDAESTTSL